MLPNVAFDSSTAVMSDYIGSPLKKQRASFQELDDESLRRRLGLGLSGVKTDVMGSIEQSNGGGTTVPAGPGLSAFGGPLSPPGSTAAAGTATTGEAMEEEEEL